MWASFTKDEQKFIVGVLAMVGLGLLALPYMRSHERGAVFAYVSNPQTQTSSTAATPLGHIVSSGATRQHGGAAGVRVDINLASAEQLDAIPGIGPTKAQAIVAYRSRAGGFRSVQELGNVDGIGPSLLAKAAPYAYVAARGTLTPNVTMNALGQATPATGPTGAAAPTKSAPAGMPMLISQTAQPWNAGPSLTKSANQRSLAVVNINTANAEELASLERVGPKLAQRIIEYRSIHGLFASPEALVNVKGIGTRIFEQNRTRIRVR